MDHIIDWPCRKGTRFYENLVLIHGYMPKLYRAMRRRARAIGYPVSCYQLMKEFEQTDPIKFGSGRFYTYVFPKFVSALGLGKMSRYKLWDGREHFGHQMVEIEFPDITMHFSFMQGPEIEQFLLHAIYIKG